MTAKSDRKDTNKRVNDRKTTKWVEITGTLVYNRADDLEKTYNAYTRLLNERNARESKRNDSKNASEVSNILKYSGAARKITILQNNFQ